MPRTSLLDTIKNDPATKALASNLGDYAAARVGAIGQSKSASTTSTPSGEEAEGVSSMDKMKGGAMSGAGEAMQSGASKVFGGLKGAVKGLFSRKGKAAKRPTNIYEAYLVPMSAQETYDAWKQYGDHAGYMKGVEKVDVQEGEDDEPEQSSWTAKIFLSRRSWKSTVEEDIPGERLRWKSEGNKGVVDGVISFVPAGENACWFIYILEYRPKGFMEWTGNRWRTVGRRTRLDVKHFIRHQAMLEREESEPQDEEQDDAAEQPDAPEQDEPDQAEEEGEDEADEPEEPERQARTARSPQVAHGVKQ